MKAAGIDEQERPLTRNGSTRKATSALDEPPGAPAYTIVCPANDRGFPLTTMLGEELCAELANDSAAAIWLLTDLDEMTCEELGQTAAWLVKQAGGTPYRGRLAKREI